MKGGGLLCFLEISTVFYDLSLSDVKIGCTLYVQLFLIKPACSEIKSINLHYNFGMNLV